MNERFDEKQYVQQVVKMLKCSKEQKEEIRRQLEADIRDARERNESDAEIKQSLGSPVAMAEEFNRTFPESEGRKYRKAKRIRILLLILGIAVIMIFISNPKYLPFLWVVLIGTGFLGIFLSLESYRLERLAIWKNPELYEKGYQTMQGLYAIGSGGLFGRGLGNSLQKLGFVPEAQNDMIFAVICEELGLVGALLLMVLFLLLLWRFMVIATRAPDLFGALIVAGILGHIAIQVILNIAVVTNTIPNTGITLPFVSYGGTSVMFLLSEMGLGLSVSRFTDCAKRR